MTGILFLENTMKEIKLSQGKVARVDDSDYEWLMQWRWFAVRNGKYWYAVRREKGSVIFMHRVIMHASQGVDIDHRDGNRLNNQRLENLRVCKDGENQRNRRLNKNSTTGYKGVSLKKAGRKYCAKVVFKGKDFYLGRFSDPVEAARAYDKKAKELFGEFAKLNFDI